MAKVHFIGIGGSGLSAIARLLLESGDTVTGSDRVLSPFAVDLQKIGATVYIGHHPRYITGADWVIRSSAIPDDNPEVVAALAANIPVYKRADFRQTDGRQDRNCGGWHTWKDHHHSHDRLGIDRTETQSILHHWQCYEQPGFHAGAGKGKAFVIEADEYDRMFLGLKPRIAIVTNLEHDHPDCYPTFEDMFAAFESFVDLLPADGTATRLR